MPAAQRCLHHLLAPIIVKWLGIGRVQFVPYWDCGVCQTRHGAGADTPGDGSQHAKSHNGVCPRPRNWLGTPCSYD